MDTHGSHTICILRRDVAHEQQQRTSGTNMAALLDVLRAVSDWRGIRGARQFRHVARGARAFWRVVRCTSARELGCVCARACCAFRCLVAWYVLFLHVVFVFHVG